MCNPFSNAFWFHKKHDQSSIGSDLGAYKGNF